MTDGPWQPCADKLSFDTEREAKSAATAVAWQRGATLAPYHCKSCGLWHLTTRHKED
jgi:hypothetical protein